MASINKFNDNGAERHRLTDTSFGRRIQYVISVGSKNTVRQWLQAHNAVMQALTPSERQSIANRQIKQLAELWLMSPKEAKTGAKVAGINIKQALKDTEKKIEAVFSEYLSDFCRPGINSQTAIVKAKRQCDILLEFLQENKIYEYSKLKRETVAKYPEWRSANRKDVRTGVASADTVNKELNRLKAVIKHGVKYCGWQERYLLDGIRVKPTLENTKAVRPFEISEVEAILEWLRKHSKKLNDWHLHDMILLALCSGLEAKALNLMQKEWFKLDLGILRVYDKLVSGVIDAKTQNRARDIPLTPTMRKLCERGYIFGRVTRTHRKSEKGGTAFAAWAESILRKAEHDTGIADINLHRFRHTCATARLSAGWQLIRVSRMLGHSSINTTAMHYAEYDLSASPQGFEGMLKIYGDFVRWVDEGYFLKI
jgi:integrase